MAVQYGESTKCPSSGLGAEWANDLYVNYASGQCGGVCELCAARGSAAYAPDFKLSFPEEKPVIPVAPAVTIDFSSKWMVGVVVMAVYSMAMVLAGAMCHKARLERQRTKKYAKVINVVDSEDFSENESRAINVE